LRDLILHCIAKPKEAGSVFNPGTRRVSTTDKLFATIVPKLAAAIPKIIAITKLFGNVVGIDGVYHARRIDG